MPYISTDRRMEVEQTEIPDTAGELNFLFTQISLEYLVKKGLRYQYINDIIGALEGCKLELYRRLVGPYEDTAIKKNGDINLMSRFLNDLG